MKTKLRSFSKMALSLVLTLCMLFACVNVGTIDAGAGTDPNRKWTIYFNEGNSSGEFNDNTNKTIDISNFADSVFDGNDLKIYVKDGYGVQYGDYQSIWYGNNRQGVPGDKSGDRYLTLHDAKNYSSIIVKVEYTGSYGDDRCTVTWVGGTLNTPQYAVNFGAVGGTGGTVTAQKSGNTSISSGDNVDKDTSVTFSNTPDDGYTFTGWYNNAAGSGAALSSASTYTTTITADTNVYAKFTEKAKHNITVTGVPSDCTFTVSRTSGGANTPTYYEGDTTIYYSANVSGTIYTLSSVTATDSESHRLTVDTSNQTIDLTNAVGDITIAATFTEDSNAHNVTVVVNNSSYGTASVDHAKAVSGMTVTVTCAETGGKFDSMSSTSNGVTLSGSGTTQTFTMPNNDVTVNVNFTEATFYTVTFSSGPNGTVTATANGNNISSGTLVREGTNVVFTAAETPNSGYTFDKWTGDNTTTNSTITLNSINQNYTVKGWFKAAPNDGTPQSGSGIPYFRYDTNKYWAEQSNYTHYFNSSTIKVKNGRAYGYIENPTAGQDYYFTLSDATDSMANCWTHKNSHSNLATETDFSGYLEVGRDELLKSVSYGVDDPTGFYLGKVKVKTGKNVSRLIIDLGKWDGSSFSFEYDTFRVIPVFNTNTEKINVYAKDGTYRGDRNYEGTIENYYDHFYNVGDTTISGSNLTNVARHTYMSTATAMRGDTITVQTEIDSAYDSTYYIKGFSFNGETPTADVTVDGRIYTQSYTIPDNFDYDYLEITPIYYYKNEATVQFYIEGFDDEVQNTGWGHTLYVYPYYSYVGGSGNYADGKSVYSRDNAFGGYPGQPVIHKGGQYYIEIPTSFTRDGHTRTIKGITLSNGYWDKVHRDYVNAVPDHKQTYDYDDFYKIYNETSAGHEVNYTADSTTFSNRSGAASQIVFRFKYRTAKNNFSDGSTGIDSHYTNNGHSGAVHLPYDSFTKAEKTSKFGNDWEDLLDYRNNPVDLFGRQLTSAEQALDPVLVVSDDYAMNYEGRYATNWVVYDWSSANNRYEKIAEIAPSALIVTSSERLGERTYTKVTDQEGYPSIEGTRLADYADEYTTLEAFRGRPVLITYEQAIKNDSSYEKYFDDDNGHKSEVALRNDGRWLYSYLNEEITSNVIIQYKNNESESKWLTDEFKSGTSQGTVTKASVNFTNTVSESEPNVISVGDPATTITARSNVNDDYAFTATEPAGYIFEGWWLVKDGVATLVTDELNGLSPMTSSATFAARYVKAPSGTLTINHTVDKNSTGGATTYVKVVAKKAGASDVTLTDPSGDGFVEDQYVIGSNYVSYGSGYTFEITLKTVPDQFSTFSEFSEGDQNGVDRIDATNKNGTDAGSGIRTVTFTVSVSELFTFTGAYPVQSFDTLDYFSALTHPYKYSFKYTYPAYIEDYGNQSYTVSGDLTHEDLDEYMTVSGGDLVFQSNEKMRTFINNIAPYEDNFMTTITWTSNTADDISNIKKSDKTSGTDYNSETNTISANITAIVSENRAIKLYFRLPYAHSAITSKFVPTETDGKINKLTEPELEPVMGTLDGVSLVPNYGETFSFNSVKTNFDQDGTILEGSSAPEWLEAPTKIYDTVKATDLYFRYWTITAHKDGAGAPIDVEYGRCYNPKFDYVMFQDCIVEPVYTELAQDETEQNVTPQNEIKKANEGVTITFIENSRNQYNEHDCGNSENVPSARQEQGDRMYTDFLVSVNDVIQDEQGNPVKLNSLNEGEMKVGLVIESVDVLDLDENGEYYTKTEEEYRVMYDGAEGANVNSTVTDIGAQIDAGTRNTYIWSETDVTKLNDKNRIRYCYSLPNRSHSNFAASQWRFKVYRAYAYVRSTTDSSKYYVSDRPVYFTIYDMGSIENCGELVVGGA